MPLNWNQMGCGCNIFTESIGGGVLCGGEAVESSSRIEAGGTVLVGGKAYVDVAGDVFDGMELVYHLQEQGVGTADEYDDSAPRDLDGTGGGSTSCPTREDGLFCLYCQTFDGTNDYIKFPQDSLQQQSFALSFWTKIDSFYNQATIFGRGSKDTTNTLVMNVGHTIMRHIHAQFNFNSDGTADLLWDAFSQTTLAQEKWYHVAVAFDYANKRCDVYLNGELDNTNDATTDETLATLENGGLIGKTNNIGFSSVIPGLGGSGFFEGSLMELRFHPETRDAVWWKAEYDNWCNGNFVLIGDEEVSTYPLT